MTPTTTDPKKEYKKSLALLQILRDEIRMNLRLAGLDATRGSGLTEPRDDRAAHTYLDRR